MAGFDAPYVPGWDCHGLPIEIKVDQQLGKKEAPDGPNRGAPGVPKIPHNSSICSASSFKRIGVFGRWDNPYST